MWYCSRCIGDDMFYCVQYRPTTATGCRQQCGYWNTWSDLGKFCGSVICRGIVTTYLKISNPEDQSITFLETPIKISPLRSGFGFAVNMRSGIVLEFMDNKTIYPTEKPETIISQM